MMKERGLIIFGLVFLALAIFQEESRAAFQWDPSAPKELDDNLAAKKVEVPVNPEATLRPKINYQAQQPRNPFFAPFKEEEPEKKFEAPKTQTEKELSSASSVPANLPPLTVQGLIWGGAFPQAIINNIVVRKGDVIEKAKVTAIEKEGVTVVFADREYKLSSPSAFGLGQPENLTGGNTSSVTPVTPVPMGSEQPKNLIGDPAAPDPQRT